MSGPPGDAADADAGTDEGPAGEVSGGPTEAAGGGRGAVRRAGALLARLGPKQLIVFLITLILAVGELRYGILGGYERLATTLIVCVACEYVFARLVQDRPPSYSSAYISGVSLAILVKPQAAILWPFALGAVLAIGSKYALRYRGRHLWNPSNFAVSVLVLLAANHVAILSEQWGNALGTNAVIWAFGLVIVSRAGVLHVTLSYVAGFLALAGVRSLITGAPYLAEVAPLTGPMYQLVVFFMLTDPRTTVGSRKGRIAVALLIALVEAGIRLAGDYHVGLLSPLYRSPPILALFLVGPVAMWWDLRRRAA